MARSRAPATHGRRGCSPQRAGDAPTPIRASSPACLRSAASILQSSCTCCQVGAWFEQPRGHREHAVDYCIHRHHKSASYRSMMLALQSMQHRVPIGGVSSSARVPRARRRDQAAPLGRSWLGWGLCLERRASTAPAGPADPDTRRSSELRAPWWRLTSGGYLNTATSKKNDAKGTYGTVRTSPTQASVVSK